MIKKNIFVEQKSDRPAKLLEVKNLSVYFKNKLGLIRAVRDISFSINEGEIVGLVGESGSGKSVTLKSLVDFNEFSITESKKMQFENIDLSKLHKNDFNFIRGTQIGYIPQDPLMSLNPTQKIKNQVFEAYLVSQKRKYQWDVFLLKNKFKDKLKNLDKNNDQYISENNLLKSELKKLKDSYKSLTSKKEVYKRSKDILEYIGIEDVEKKWNLYPHEFSGGMRQRIVIAIAIIAKPKLIIADEPTTALDVTVQAKVIDLIKKMSKEFNVAVIFISHNIGLVANLCDYIYVMYAGKIVEQAKTWELFSNPRHPYTWALISSIPDADTDSKLTLIPGSPPNMISPIKGDAFAPRNKYAIKLDFEKQPPMFKISESHKAATWLLHPQSPNIPVPSEVVKKINSAIGAINNKKKEDKNGKKSNSKSRESK
ncbi:MAG: ABC transporter ATP-binding protein [Mycoplasmoidaceae bacterium]